MTHSTFYYRFYDCLGAGRGGKAGASKILLKSTRLGGLELLFVRAVFCASDGMHERATSEPEKEEDLEAENRELEDGVRKMFGLPGAFT